MTELLLHVLNSPFEAFQHLFSFLADVSQLPIGKVGHVGNEDLAVIPEREERRSRTLSVALLPVRGLIGKGRLGGTGPADDRRRVMRWGLSKGIEKRRCNDAAIGKGSDVLQVMLRRSLLGLVDCI